MALTTFANFSFKLFAVILGVIGFWHVYETRQGQSIKPHSIAVSPGFDWNTVGLTSNTINGEILIVLHHFSS